jgi:outer membrane protein OmpA-like peptidoglycan-associated protein
LERFNPTLGRFTPFPEHFTPLLKRMTPFAEALTGGQHLSPKGFSSGNKAAYMFGVGVDVKVNSSFSVRPFQLSYIYTTYSAPPTSLQPKNTLNGFMLQSGLVYNLKLFSTKGNVLASCSAEPWAVVSGGKIKIGVTTEGFLPRQKLHYSYVTTGGAISGSTETESVDTAGLRPGDYTVIAKVVDDGTGKHQHTASCQIQFSVNANQPSTPVESQQPPPILDAMTPSPPVETQPAPPHTAEAKLTPPTANEMSLPASPPDPESAEATSSLTAGHPTPSKFGFIEFARDLKRPARVDNEAKGELDRFAEALAAVPDATGVLVGYAKSKDGRVHKRVLGLAGARAVNTKVYLTKEKGIDPGRIQPRAGSAEDDNFELWIVPAAANFVPEGTRLVDESTVRPLRPLHKKHKRKPHQLAGKTGSYPHS